ncbi:PAS domain-containing hybrid sensor histidine kinase/response regulator [Ectothiorhodospira mobilis]|uniref:PAS domain-containing hybrid sensor histidine kinase/response regulator n=1 Tax=Ectothiorhodospira mobilis TaxID=195064 RepID=UPI0019033057|nr:ATP-binding protein [Ectothiorhodospira mobilis]
MAERPHPLERIAAHLPALIYQYRLHPDGTAALPYASNAVHALYGLSPEEATGDINCLFERIHPEDRQGFQDSITRSAEQMTPWQAEYRILHPHKGEIWVQAHALPERLPDGSILWSGYKLDITEHKRLQAELSESRAKLQEAGHLARLGHFEIHLDRGEVWLSDLAFLIHGHTPGTFRPSLRRYSRLVHPEDRDRIRAVLKQAIRGDIDDVQTSEHRIVKPDGTVAWVHTETRIQRRHKGRGRTKRIFGTIQDITAHKRVEEDLRASKSVSDRANQLKSDFILGMSHELRTPMNAILGFAQLLDADPELNADQRENVQEILKAGDHLLELMNEILDLSRVESGRMELAAVTVDCEILAQECITLARPLAEPRGIRLECRVEETPHALGDGLRLKQVLVNLLSNGIKYNHPEGRVDLHVRPQGEWVHMEVSDTGHGIPPGRLEELFQPFNRLDRTEVEGTGIGLVICKRLVEAMGGTISVQSEPGRGSRFCVRLPRARPEQAAREDMGIATAPTREAPRARGRVLHIDDNPGNLRLMQRLAARLGEVELIVAATPSLGIDLAVAYHPDLILMDIHMPGINGFEALRTLRDIPTLQDTPVVALTACASRDQIHRGQEAGFDGYLTLPLNLQEVLDTVHQHLHDGSRPAQTARNQERRPVRTYATPAAHRHAVPAPGPDGTGLCRPGLARPPAPGSG